MFSIIIVIILLDHIFCYIIDYDVIIEKNRSGGWLPSNWTIDNVIMVSSKTGLRRIGFFYRRWENTTRKAVFWSTWNDNKFTKENDIYKSEDTTNYLSFEKYDYLMKYDPLMLAIYKTYNGNMYSVGRVAIGSYILFKA